MFSSTEQIGLTWWRVLLGIVAVVLVADVAFETGHSAWFYATHPAPLGRSAPAVTRTLLRDFPPGTLVDHAVNGLRQRGIEVSYKTGDTTLFGVERDVKDNLFIRTDIPFWAHVDALGHIDRWSVDTRLTGP